jgi:hypothetical protein
MRFFSTALTLLTLAQRGLGDDCADFCKQQLGAPRCAKGSYCKKGHDCHALFWTDEQKSSICIFGVDPNCRNSRPVLCGEARDRLRGEPTVPPVEAPPRIPKPQRVDCKSRLEGEIRQQKNALIDHLERLAVEFVSDRPDEISVAVSSALDEVLVSSLPLAVDKILSASSGCHAVDVQLAESTCEQLPTLLDEIVPRIVATLISHRDRVRQSLAQDFEIVVREINRIVDAADASFVSLLVDAKGAEQMEVGFLGIRDSLDFGLELSERSAHGNLKVYMGEFSSMKDHIRALITRYEDLLQEKAQSFLEKPVVPDVPLPTPPVEKKDDLDENEVDATTDRPSDAGIAKGSVSPEKIADQKHGSIERVQNKAAPSETTRVPLATTATPDTLKQWVPGGLDGLKSSLTDFMSKRLTGAAIPKFVTDSRKQQAGGADPMKKEIGTGDLKRSLTDLMSKRLTGTAIPRFVTESREQQAGDAVPLKQEAETKDVDEQLSLAEIMLRRARAGPNPTPFVESEDKAEEGRKTGNQMSLSDMLKNRLSAGATPIPVVDIDAGTSSGAAMKGKRSAHLCLKDIAARKRPEEGDEGADCGIPTLRPVAAKSETTTVPGMANPFGIGADVLSKLRKKADESQDSKALEEVMRKAREDRLRKDQAEAAEKARWEALTPAERRRELEERKKQATTVAPSAPKPVNPFSKMGDVLSKRKRMIEDSIDSEKLDAIVKQTREDAERKQREKEAEEARIAGLTPAQRREELKAKDEASPVPASLIGEREKDLLARRRASLTEPEKKKKKDDGEDAETELETDDDESDWEFSRDKAPARPVDIVPEKRVSLPLGSLFGAKFELPSFKMFGKSAPQDSDDDWDE